MPEGAVMLMTRMLNAIMMLMLEKIRLMTMMFNEMMMLMLVKIRLMTRMLKAEDSIQISPDTISGLYCSLYWEMTTIMMKLKKKMMEMKTKIFFVKQSCF